MGRAESRTRINTLRVNYVAVDITHPYIKQNFQLALIVF